MQESTKNGVWNMIRKTSVFYDDDRDEEERNGQWENKSNNKNTFSFPKKTHKKIKNKLFDGNQVSSTFCSGKLFLLQNFISLLNV